MIVFTPTVEQLEMFMNFVGLNAAFSFGSDAAAQLVLEGTSLHSFDLSRACRYASTGVIFCGVTQFGRLKIIEAVVHEGGGLATAVEKTVINQLVFSPLVRLASMSSLIFMNTGCWETVKEKVVGDFLEAQSLSYLVKPASNLIAFVVFPHQIFMQAVTMRSVSFVYNTYYSHISHRPHKEGDKEEHSVSSDSESPVVQLMNEAEVAESSQDENVQNTRPPTPSDFDDLVDMRAHLEMLAEKRRRRLSRMHSMQLARLREVNKKNNRSTCSWFTSVTGLWR
eukprot:TRINITY_DN30045_c0_g1_i1.p1 TRINITY_DN30045_c0_g1~~TRINITY_DN30045_c0_g1_i1.p1  ORF type:complete len:294 (+),score=110.15 TRINITY_DN30045_c0_g1_i1:42-884(+)